MERERLRQRILHAGDTLVARLNEVGRHAEAIDAGLVMIALEPLREASHHNLVRAHLTEGNLGEAMRQIDRCCELFIGELGIDVRPTFDVLLGADPSELRSVSTIN